MGLKVDDILFVITLDVLSELNSTERYISSKRSEIIDQAISEGSLQLVNTSLSKIQKFESQIPRAKLSTSDVSLIALALFYKDRGDDPEIATYDKVIVDMCIRFGIKLIKDDEIQLLLELGRIEEKHTGLNQKINEFETRENGNLWKQLLFGIFSAFIGGIISTNLNAIVKDLHIYGSIIGFLIIAFGLFYWRERERISYGVFEFSIGFLAIIIVLLPVNFEINQYTNIDTDIKIIGGLYIMVRGLDNLVKGLQGFKLGVYLSRRWKIGV